MKIIDLRSDTVTKPSIEMRKAMYEAEVGDDVYKEDPTVNRLESYTAELLGKEKALFVPTGLMGNQICLNILTHRNSEVICDIGSHIFQYESGTAAASSGIQIYPVQGKNGIITPELVRAAIRPESAYYMPRTKVVEIENTHNRAGGIIQPIGNIQALAHLVEEYGLAFHLDGARLWNACAETNISPDEYSKYFDSVSVCLSKGLGAPIGSVIAGEKGFIDEAFRLRKAWGGGMRQVGIIAAAGLYALENNMSKLKADHQKAKLLAEFLNGFENVNVNVDLVQTNILAFELKNINDADFIQKCKENGLLVGPMGNGIVRIVTHMDISDDDITQAKSILSKVLN